MEVCRPGVLKRSQTLSAPSSFQPILSNSPSNSPPVNGIRFARSKSTPGHRRRGTPLRRKMSLLPGRAVIIGLGWTSDQDELEDGPRKGISTGKPLAKEPTNIMDLSDRCIMAVMANIADLGEWTSYKLVCKRWRRLANDSLQTLQVRDSRPLGSPGFLNALGDFVNLRCLQLHVSVSGVVTDGLLARLGSACPQLRSLHISYMEGGDAGGERRTGQELTAVDEEGLPSLTGVTAVGLDALFRSCKGLEELTLAGISHGASHQAVRFDLPEAVGELSGLKALALHSRGCTSLPEMFGNLFNLTELSLGCEGITALPATFGQLENLISLDLSSCHNLTCLPESIGGLTKLTNLEIRGCGNLQTLPEPLGSLHSLTRLNCQDCKNLVALPESIGNLISLVDLHLQGCRALTALPDSIGCLTNLTSLGVRDCDSLAFVPESIENLVNLNSEDMSRLLGLSIQRLISPVGR